MRTYQYRVAGEPVSVHRVEDRDDLDDFIYFVEEHVKSLAVDIEATGLDIYAKGFRPRLIQFGNEYEAYVLPIEQRELYVHAAKWALEQLDALIFHNLLYDLPVIDKHLGVSMESLWPKVWDTRTLAHLVDPRGPEEGGIGQSLEPLTAHYIDAEVAEEVKGLMTRLAKEHKVTKAKIWELIDLDHPEYNLYAGMDTILTKRLAHILWPLVPPTSRELIAFERDLAEVCSYYQRTGYLLDVGYSTELSDQLREAEEKYAAEALNLGVENVNSTDQVAERLMARGVEIPGRTPKGKPKVDKILLNSLVEQGDPLAIAVQEAKKAGKWRTTWVDGFLAQRDEEDRCHPSINPLRARTARMSITGIPAQTLPASDSTIRRCFLADEGHSTVSVDYASQELRVTAALSGDQTMMEAFERGESLHLVTARSAFPDVTVVKDDKYYKLAKTANFQKVYGGGAKGLAQQTGIDLETARQVHEGFDRAYPSVKAMSKRVAKQAERDGYVTTPTGRRLPVDANRSYSALNYIIQSTSRDVTARGLVRAHREGFTPYIRLPVHDEAVASFPSEMAEYEAVMLAEVMSEQMGPVFIDTDYEVGKRSWGSLYGSEY